MEPQQRHAVNSVPDHQFLDRLLGPFGGEKEHDYLGLESWLNAGANRATQNGSARISGMNRHQTPTLAVKVVNGTMGWFLRVQSRSEDVNGGCAAQGAHDGGVCVSKHGYLSAVFLFNQCSFPKQQYKRVLKCNDFMSKSFLLVGGSSDIARHLAALLLDDNHQVTLLARDGERVNELVDRGAHFIEATP